ncbi:hypothetical protein [Haloplanus sp. C73]|uniref:hypothetical protein n=1 Tax=Haloplanus sp. C73 TaxID=3421641 RepID=UPI003EB8110C
MLGGLKALIPGTARYSEKHHVKYLHKKASGHDALLLVEWEDGKLTELGADVHPEMDGWYQATNNLIFAPIGEGTDPVDYYGVSVIKCHAQIACPFSTEACLAAEFDEAGEFRYQVDPDSNTTQRVVEVEMGDQPAPEEGKAANGQGEAVADGGAEKVREYDLRPPAGAVGYSFSLTQAKQRAPNAISANMVRRAVEYGKEKARNEGRYMKGLLHGGGLVLGTLIILAILYIIGASVLGGGGGGGGGGGQVLSILALLAGPRLKSVWGEIRDEFSLYWNAIREDPILAVWVAFSSLLKVATGGLFLIGYVLATITGALFWGQFLDRHPEVATTTVQWIGGPQPFSAVLGDFYWMAMAAPLVGFCYWYVRCADDLVRERWGPTDAE